MLLIYQTRVLRTPCNLLATLAILFSLTPLFAEGQTEEEGANECPKRIAELRFDDGVTTAVEKIEQLISTPSETGAVFVAVWGYPDSGKSYLINMIAEHFEKAGIDCSKGVVASPKKKSFTNKRNK